MNWKKVILFKNWACAEPWTCPFKQIFCKIPENINSKWRSQHYAQVMVWHICHAQAFCRPLLPALISHNCKTLGGLIWDHGFFLLPTGSLDLFLILSCTTFNFLYLSFFTLFSSCLWRTDTIVQWFQNKPATAEIPRLLNCLLLTALHLLALGAFCSSIVTSAYFSRVGQPLQNILNK